LIVAGRVDDEFADEPAGAGVDDADVLRILTRVPVRRRPMPLWWSFEW
jgi:hypothetical protein